MKALSVANLKANFSKVLESVKRGEEIVVEYGKKHEKLAVIIPFRRYKNKKRNIGILRGKAAFKTKSNFKISDEELSSI